MVWSITELDALLGYLAGAPTYSLIAELALNRTVNGHLPAVSEYQDALSQAGARRRPLHADFSLTHARMGGERGDIVGAIGQAAKAVIEMAHALACRRWLWVLNEKKIVERAGLQDLHIRFVDVPTSSSGLLDWVDGLRAAIGRA